MSPDAEFRDGLLASIPKLRKFALALTHNRAMADDLVQETLVRAWANHHQFTRGTSLGSWLYTILRNECFSQARRRRREVVGSGIDSAALGMPPNQQGALDIQNLQLALTKIPVRQREALLLIGAEGLTYEEAAHICKVRVGTIKSRVSRARCRLSEILDIRQKQDLGPDPNVCAAIQDLQQV